MKNLILALLSTAFLAACQNATSVKQADLQGKWQITAIQGLNQVFPAHLSFKDNMVSGSSGCNQFMGQYAVNDGEISFDALASTKKMCPPDQMKQEDTLFSLLHGTFEAQYNNGKLALTRDNKTLIQVEKASDQN